MREQKNSASSLDAYHETIVQLATCNIATSQAQEAALSPDDVVAEAVFDLPEAPVAELVTDEDRESRERFEALHVIDHQVHAKARVTSGPAVEIDTQIASYARPEYIHAQVIKPTYSASVGLAFRSRIIRDKVTGKSFLRTFITSITDDGLFGCLSSRYLRPGDEVISVNNVSTLKMDATKIATRLRNARGTISITARNDNGDPRNVASTVPKPKQNGRIGLSVRSNIAGTKLKIHDVNDDSIFANSLLVAGHRCLEINGHSCKSMLATEAAECLRNSKSDLVTIVSRAPAKQQQRAVVLCCEPQPKSFKSIIKRKLWGKSATAQPIHRE